MNSQSKPNIFFPSATCLTCKSDVSSHGVTTGSHFYKCVLKKGAHYSYETTPKDASYVSDGPSKIHSPPFVQKCEEVLKVDLKTKQSFIFVTEWISCEISVSDAHWPQTQCNHCKKSGCKTENTFFFNTNPEILCFYYLKLILSDYHSCAGG